MDAADIARRRHRRRRQTQRVGPRLWHIAAITVLLVLLGATLALTAGAFGGALTALRFLRDVPDVARLRELPGQFAPTTATTRLYALVEPGAGERPLVLIDEITDPRLEGRGWLRPDQLPPVVVAASIAAEDPYFLTAPRPGLGRALAQWAGSGRITEPLSPFVQTLSREHLLAGTTPNDAHQALREWLVGRELLRAYSREELLTFVLNTRYYGNLAYGIEAAAHVYFGKPSEELTPEEAALLAAVGIDPARNPFDDPAGALAGQSTVLQSMRAQGYLEPTYAVEPSLPLLAPSPGSRATAPHFSRPARRELERLLGPERLLQGGLQVETTLDLDLQWQATCAIDAYRNRSDGAAMRDSSGGGPPCPAADGLTDIPDSSDGFQPASAAVVALDPVTGAIEALVGPSDGDLSLPARPLGSLVRPFIYLTALSRGYSAATLLMDVESVYLQDGRPFIPRNADGQFLGPLRLREAMAKNRAVPATDLLSRVGAARVLDSARALGLAPVADSDSDVAFATEGFAVDLLDIAMAFAAIGNGGALSGVSNGEVIEPTTIRRVATEDGTTIYDLDSATRDILTPELAYLTTDILADASARCTGDTCPDLPALPDGRRVAVAAGESPESGDFWTVGFTPERVLGVWLGDKANTDATLTGRDTAGPLWRALMAYDRAQESTPAAWRRPAGLREVEVCAVSGLLPRRGANGRAHCPTVREWFVDGTQPTAQDDMVREAVVNRETGRLATIFTPPQLLERRSFVVYPLEAASWAAAAGVPAMPTEYDTIRHIPQRSANAAALTLEPWSTVSGQLPITGSAGGDDFAHYRLAYFNGLYPDAMRTIAGPIELPVMEGELGVWDTSLVNDGLFTLLLTVARHDGTFSEVAIPVTVRNSK